MPQVKNKNGKTVITLYEAEKAALAKSLEIMRFVGKIGEGELAKSAIETATGIEAVVRALPPPEPKKKKGAAS